MVDPLQDRILRAIKEAPKRYNRLVLVVAPPGSEKTAALQSLSCALDAPLLNLNLQLCRNMLDLTMRQKTLRLPAMLEEIVDSPKGDVVLLDNIEILFEPSLEQDPLRLLQGVSRNRTIVASWGGAIRNGRLVYAAPGHAEYRSYEATGFLCVGWDSDSLGISNQTKE